MPRLRSYCVFALLLAALAGILPSMATAVPPDHDVGSGHFYGQTGRGDGSGYFVLDEGSEASARQMRFWSEFRRLGALDTLGYPISRRFVGAGGFTYQAFQRGVLQWRPESGAAVLANTFEWLQQSSRDDWLNGIGVPSPVADDGSGGDWQRARETRLGWLTEPRIKEKFLSNPTGGAGTWSPDEAIQLYGLPMSRPEKRGPFVVQRFQRIAFQLWLEPVPGMPAPGAVVAVLGGDMLKQSGIIPSEATAPEGTSPGTQVEKKVAKGVYISYHALSRDSYLQRIYDLASTTEINAIVVDVKGDHGLTSFASAEPLAKEIGAAGKPTVANFPDLVARLHQRGLYVIGRVVVFKDNPLAIARPALAVRDARTGRPWRDTSGLGWTDPYREETWDYNIAIAKEAARAGVDEIQFDYIRFPIDGATGDATFAQPSTMANRTAAINGFLARARTELQPLNVKLSADLFGFTAWRQDDLGIGQRIVDMAKHLDVVSPMLYPSTFGNAVQAYRPAVAYPYEIVQQSVQRAVRQVGTVAVRPWLQDFADYAYDKRPYTAAEVSAQIRGAKDGGAAGWLLWNAEIRYTKEALAPK